MNAFDRLAEAMSALTEARRRFVDAEHYARIAPVGHWAESLTVLLRADKAQAEALRDALVAWGEFAPTTYAEEMHHG